MPDAGKSGDPAAAGQTKRRGFDRSAITGERGAFMREMSELCPAVANPLATDLAGAASASGQRTVTIVI